MEEGEVEKGSRPATPAERLVIALGWDLDDFFARIEEEDHEVLRQCLAILETDTPEAEEWVNRRAEAGAHAIRKILGEPREPGVRADEVET